MKSAGNKPPGASSFNIEPTISENGSDAAVELLDSLPVGAIFVDEGSPSVTGATPRRTTGKSPWCGPRDEWRNHTPYWKEPGIRAREAIGDCYAMVADSILTLSQPFPGDDLYNSTNVLPELRFSITEHTSGDSYSVYDRLVEERVLLTKSLLKRPQFDIGRWYAMHRSRARGLDLSVPHTGKMGLPLSIVATKLLTDGITSHFSCIRPRSDLSTRFLVTQTPYCKRTNEYVIIDRDLMSHSYITIAQLEDPSFNLVSWYL